MNILKKATFFVAFAGLVISGCNNGKKLVQANDAYKNSRYADAANLYKEAIGSIKDKGAKAEATYKAADCFRRRQDYKNAEVWYKKAIKLKAAEPQAYLYLADAIKAQERYDEAIVEYNNYIKAAPDDPRGQNGVESCKLAQKWKDAPTKYEVSNVTPLNTKYNDWGVAYIKKNYKEILFTSSRVGADGGANESWLGQSHEDIYSTVQDKSGKWSAPVALGSPISSKANEASPSTNNKYNLMIFTRCAEKKEGTLGCQIYESKKKGANAFDEPVLIPLAADSFSCGDPALTATEDTLFFASDMEGGLGGTDIWYVLRDKKKKEWGSPINLGAPVNTPGNERFPFSHDDGTLYFSSDYHLGMGGLDLFQAKKNGTKFTDVANLKYPINSSGDDFGIVFQGESATGEYMEKGYFSSNRKGGKGNDDIYSFMLPPPCITLSGIVRDINTKAPISGVKVMINGSDGSVLEATTDAAGSFAVDCKPTAKFKLNKSFETNVTKADYLNETGVLKFDTKGLEESKDFKQEFFLKNTRGPIRLPKILYDVNRWELKPQFQDSLVGLIKTLNDNPTIVVELMSHTDSRNTDAYNDTLSQKRAQSVVDFLISKGIDPGRLQAKGYGERNPVNRCKDGVKCSEDEYSENRRTEFRVLRNDYVAPKDPSKQGPVKIDIEEEDAPEGERIYDPNAPQAPKN